MDTLDHMPELHELPDQPEKPESNSPVFLRLCLRMRHIRDMIVDIDHDDWLVVAGQQEKEIIGLLTDTKLNADEWNILYKILHERNPQK